MAITVTNPIILTSNVLVPGQVYTRAALKNEFGIADATINTGVFRPKGHNSVWLFVTESKTSDRTQYVDLLEGDVLHWQGQRSGRTDSLIREHRDRDLDLLLFYRHAKYEFAGAGFRYEGIFDHVSDEGELPTSFVLRRRALDELAVARQQAEMTQAFDPDGVEDARTRILGAIVRRHGQAAFRQNLLRAYAGRCAISGCDVQDVLEAAHIYPYQGANTNAVTNGLLLRADLHTLFDLGLISIDGPTGCVLLHSSLRGTEYDRWHGQPIRLPANLAQHPSAGALLWHRENIGSGI